MGNCCEPSGASSLRRKRNVSHEPLSDFLNQEIVRSELIAFLTKQRLHVSKQQLSIRKLHDELSNASNSVTELAAQREQFLSIVKAVEDDKKLYKGVINGIKVKLEEHAMNVQAVFDDLRVHSSVDDTVLLTSAKHTYFERNIPKIELILAQFIKYFTYLARKQEHNKAANACIHFLESGTKKLMALVDEVVGKVNAGASELSLTKMGVESDVDKYDLGRVEEGVADALFKLFEETEIEIDITRKESLRLSDFCYDLFEETQGIARLYKSETDEDHRLTASATAFETEVKLHLLTDNPKLTEKVTVFSAMVTERNKTNSEES